MEGQRFLFSSCTLLKDELFFIETQNGLPAMMNLNNGSITYHDAMDGFILRAGDVVDFIDNYENKVYVLETSGINLVIFDLAKKLCEYIELNCNRCAWGNYAAFERYESYYYIFPKYGNKVIVLNTNNNEMIEIPNCFDGLNEIQCTCRVENQIWILAQNENKMFVFDLTTHKVKIYKLKTVLKNCVDAVFADGNIFILNRFGIIYQWNINNEELHENTMLETEHIENESMCRIVYAGNKFILFPALGMDIKLLDLSTGETKVYHDYPADFTYHDITWSKYYRGCEDKDYYYFAMRLGNYLLKICKHNGNLSWIKPQMPLDGERVKIQTLLTEQTLQLHLAAKRAIFEDNNIDVIRMLNANSEENCIENEIGIGKIIYEKVK